MAIPTRVPNFMGEPNVCETTCEHQDCAEFKATANDPCNLCDKRIAKGADYSYIENGKRTHFFCAWARSMRLAGADESEIGTLHPTEIGWEEIQVS